MDRYEEGMGGGGKGFFPRIGEGTRDGTTGGMCVGEGIGGITAGSPVSVGSIVGYVRLRPGVRVWTDGDRLGVLDVLDGARDRETAGLSSGIAGILFAGDCDDVDMSGNV